jgi:acetyltransferase-like isoleucine patch superfamily enzyme
MVKAFARAVALLVMAPALLSFVVRRATVGPERALEGSMQALALVPGLTGEYLRRAFLSRVISHCAPSATIQFGTLFSQAGAYVDENVYVGPRCHIGLAHLERDVLLAAGVHITSGQATHGTDDPNRPIRDQPGALTMVRIGEGTWVGSAAIILADVGKHCVIGAGSVVTKPLPDYVVAAGVPARVIRSRHPEAHQAQ